MSAWDWGNNQSCWISCVTLLFVNIDKHQQTEEPIKTPLKSLIQPIFYLLGKLSHKLTGTQRNYKKSKLLWECVAAARSRGRCGWQEVSGMSPPPRCGPMSVCVCVTVCVCVCVPSTSTSGDTAPPLKTDLLTSNRWFTDFTYISP